MAVKTMINEPEKEKRRAQDAYQPELEQIKGSGDVMHFNLTGNDEIPLEPEKEKEDYGD